MSKKKIDYKNYKELELEKWNATSFREYAKDLNIQKFGVPCITNNIRQENAVISNMIKEFGREAVKRFIEVSIERYRPNMQYPTINIMTMYSFGKAYELPRVLKELADKKKVQEAIKEEKTQSFEDLKNYF